MVVAIMRVKLGLSSVRSAISGYVRDGVISIGSRLGRPGFVEQLDLREHRGLAAETTCVWVVGQSAIIAEHRSDSLSELKLVAVKGILFNDTVATHNWELIESEFKKSGHLINSESISREDTGDIATPLCERELMQDPRPEVGDEGTFKGRLRESLKGHQPINPGLPNQRTLNDAEIEKWVEEDWEHHKRRVGEEQQRWDEIQALLPLTTERATELYLARKAQGELTPNHFPAHEDNEHMPTKVLHQSLDDVISSVEKSSAPGLAIRGVRHDLAIWSVGNCLVTALGVGKGTTEVTLANYRLTQPDDDACEAWNALAAFWASVGWIAKAENYVRVEHVDAGASELQAYESDPVGYEKQWRAKQSADLAIVANGAGVRAQVEASWQEQLQAFESKLRSKRELQAAREAAANKTPNEAAGEYWSMVERKQSAATSPVSENMNDSELQDLILRKYYARRGEGYIPVTENLFGSEVGKFTVLRISEQLRQLGRIDFKSIRDGEGKLDAGWGQINVFGVRQVEGFAPNPAIVAQGGEAMESLDIFISHSSEDKDIAEGLAELFRAALPIDPQKIRVTSVDGFRLPAGASTGNQLREDIVNARVLIGVITEAGMNSTWVLFELGARWGANRAIIPLLAGAADSSLLRGPLADPNALACDRPAQLLQLVRNVGGDLDLKVHPADVYLKQIEMVVQLSKTKSAEQPRQTNVVETGEGQSASESYDRDDLISMIQDYLYEKRKVKGNTEFLLRFADIDGELKLSRGTAKLYTEDAARAAGCDVIRKGNDTVLLVFPLKGIALG